MSKASSILLTTGYFDDLDIRFAQRMARLTGESDLAVLLGAAAASRAISDGNVCADLSSLAGALIGESGGDDEIRWPVLDDWVSRLQSSQLVGEPGSTAPLILDSGSKLYLRRHWDYQERLVLEISNRKCSPKIIQSTIQEDGRAKAVRLARDCDLLIVSGGPGTGKTAIVAAILADLLEHSLQQNDPTPRIIALAPTGKAAARLRESIIGAKIATGSGALNCGEQIRKMIPEETSTIHRALGRSFNRPTEFLHNKDRPLEADIVVVDESSMIGLALMTKLIEAVPPSAKIILLGDTDQLAPVEAGAVFVDLCNANKDSVKDITGGDVLPIVHLSHSYRFGESSGIGKLAVAMKNGDLTAILKVLNDDEFPDVSLIEPRDASDYGEFIEKLSLSFYGDYMNKTSPVKALEKFEEVRILAALREGPFGVKGINTLIERALSRISKLTIRDEWYHGRPVLISNNNYDLGLYNGDVGLMINQSGNDPAVVFADSGGSVKYFSPSRIPACETVFAMTVHKAQGSEYDKVVVILPEKSSPIITRELLYTACTRAKRKLTVYASKNAIQQAITSFSRQRPVSLLHG